MSKKDELLLKLRAMLSENALTPDELYKAGVACSVQVPLAKVREAVSACAEAGFYLESETALDFEDTLELVYHVNCYEPKSRIVLRALCAHGEVAPTVSDIFSTAVWQEREAREFFGIEFAGHPDPRNLLLPEDSDDHPLKKTYGKVYANRKREEIYG